jgi:protein kinase A
MRLFAGTFARVWLARLANPRHEDRNKVFALKVLKKVDGMSRKSIARKST